jgi:hypothetical protein
MENMPGSPTPVINRKISKYRDCKGGQRKLTGFGDHVVKKQVLGNFEKVTLPF